MDNTQQIVIDSVMARRLRVRVAWLREQAQAGNLPHIRAGDRFLFNPDAVFKVLAERASVPASSLAKKDGDDADCEVPK